MKWLNEIVDKILGDNSTGDIVVSSGVSPSGTYHLGTMREVLTAEAIAAEVRRRGRTARHLHIVDDLDVFRKVPANIPEEWSQYLGMPLSDVPSPDGKAPSYAEFFLSDLEKAIEVMDLDIEVVRQHERYREGAFAGVIEQALDNVETIKKVLAEVSGRELEDNWTPIQVVDEAGRIKNRLFKSIDKESKTVIYEGKDGEDAVASYADGHVKLSWRVDWPARWALLGVVAEPFGRDHATKGGSYDTGVRIVREVYGVEPPAPVPYDFINRVGETKKMSKSSGNVVTATQLLEIMPPEMVWFFILRYSPDKQLFFGEGETLLKLFDEFAALLDKDDKTDDEKQLIELCLGGVEERTVASLPFSLLVESYQAALRNPETTLEIIARTEYADTVKEQAEIVRKELRFIDNWIDKSAPDNLKFSLTSEARESNFSDLEKMFLAGLADKIAAAPADADGEWFHLAIYEFKTSLEMQPKELFSALYRLTIGKTSGPRAGWFLSILPRDWLLRRLRFEA